jgi:Carboxypeptidase regulatory-like domain
MGAAVSRRGNMKTRAIAACVLAAGIWATPGRAQDQNPSLITITVVVTDAKTEKPVNQAHLTLIFREKEGRAIRYKTLSYTAKTDAQGHCRFLYVPEGTVQLLVTNEGYQAFGREFEVSKEHPTLEVKLKPPQPVL